MCDFSFLSTPTPDQIRQIMALYRAEGWGTPASDEPAAVTRIVAGSHCFLIATRGNEIVGMGRAISDRASDAYIQDVTVKRAYRGRGIGTRIVKKLIDNLHADGLAWIGLIAERDSAAFYARLGFETMPNASPMLKQFYGIQKDNT